MQKVLGFAMMLVSGATMAGWFGPSTYEECLLENLKGVASDVAATGIAKACRAKFPIPPPPPPTAEELQKAKKREAASRARRAECESRPNMDPFDCSLKEIMMWGVDP